MLARAGIRDAQNVTHHQTDGSSDSPAVDEQVVDRDVGRLVDVHLHPVQERARVVDGHGSPTHDFLETGENRIQRGCAAKHIGQLRAQPLERGSVTRGRDEVDRIVTAPAPGVERRDLVPLLEREQPRSPVEAARVLGDDAAAGLPAFGVTHGGSPRGRGQR